MSPRLPVSVSVFVALLWPFRWWGDGDEVFNEATPVFVEQLVDSLETWGTND